MAGRRPPRGASEGLLRPKPRPKGVLALDDVIAALVELDANGLCLQWRNHLGGTPPAHLPRWLLMKILAYRIQATAFGGLDKETLRGHCHMNRFYWSVLTTWQEPVSIKSMG